MPDDGDGDGDEEGVPGGELGLIDADGESEGEPDGAIDGEALADSDDEGL